MISTEHGNLVRRLLLHQEFSESHYKVLALVILALSRSDSVFHRTTRNNLYFHSPLLAKE